MSLTMPQAGPAAKGTPPPRAARSSSFDEAAVAWAEAAEAAHAGPLDTYGWWNAWLATRKDGSDFGPPVVTTVRFPDGRPAAVLAMRRRRFGPFRVLEPLGERGLPARAVLMAPGLAGRLRQEHLEHVLRDLAGQAGGADLVILPAMPARIGGHANPFLSLRSRREQGGISIVRLCTPWERCDARHRGRKTRRKALTREMELAGRGELRFLVADTAAEREAFARELVRQRDYAPDTSIRTGRTGERVRPDLALGLSQLAGADLGPQSWLTALECGGRLIAVALGIADRRSYAGLRLTIEGRDRQAGAAGDLLLRRTLELGVERGLQRFALPPSVSSRLGHWTDEWVDLHRATMPLTRLGQLAEDALHRFPILPSPERTVEQALHGAAARRFAAMP